MHWYLIVERGLRGLVFFGLGLYALTFLLHGMGAFVAAVELRTGAGTRDALWAQYLDALLQRLLTLTPREVGALALVAILYGLLELAEAIGLLVRRRWAEYLVVVATALGIPLEVEELTRHPTALKATLLLINVLIVVYLVWRKRLFRLAA